MGGDRVVSFPAILMISKQCTKELSNNKVEHCAASKLSEIDDRKGGFIEIIQPPLRSSICDVFTQPNAPLYCLTAPGLFHSFSPEETIEFAAKFAAELKPNDVLLLTGDLGAGKTTFVKGLLQGLNSSDFAQSPTFVYLQIYEASLPVFHFDLYRLREAGDFLAMGFEEFFTKEGICIIEWPERISSVAPKNAIHIKLIALSENERALELKREAS